MKRSPTTTRVAIQPNWRYNLAVMLTDETSGSYTATFTNIAGTVTLPTPAYFTIPGTWILCVVFLLSLSLSLSLSVSVYLFSPSPSSLSPSWCTLVLCCIISLSNYPCGILATVTQGRRTGSKSGGGSDL